jgi:hypothetical protein
MRSPQDVAPADCNSRLTRSRSSGRFNGANAEPVLEDPQLLESFGAFERRCRERGHL